MPKCKPFVSFQGAHAYNMERKGCVEMNESCVTVCARRVDAELWPLVRVGRRLADQSGRALRILLLQDQSARGRGEALEYAFSCARGADADLDACYTGNEERMKAYMRRGTALLLVDAGDEGLLRLGRAAFSGREGESPAETDEEQVRALARL